MGNSVFYHAGCSVCVSAEKEILGLLDPSKVEVVHLGESNGRVSEAKAAGVRSVPALLTPNGQVLHINFGAAIEDLEN